MLKTKSFLLAVGVVLAVAFTFSCSSDGGEGGFGDRGGDKSGGGNGGSETEISSSSLRISSSSVGSSQGGGISSSVGGGVVYGSSVNYGGKTYKTVKIGSQTWFAENLDYNPNTGNSACYNNQASNCNTYGRLYDWATAMGLPSSCNSNYCSSQIQSKHRGICPAGWHIPSNTEWDRLYRYVDGTSDTKIPYRSETAGRYLKATSFGGTNQYGFSALPGGGGRPDGSFRDVGSNGYWWSASESEDSSDHAYGRYMNYDEEDARWNNTSESALFSIRCLQD